MNRPTPLTAEQAAEILGIEVWDLGVHLRDAAFKEAQEAADRVRRGYGLDVGKARRLLAAAVACEKACYDVMAAEEESEHEEAKA